MLPYSSARINYRGTWVQSGRGICLSQAGGGYTRWLASAAVASAAEAQTAAAAVLTAVAYTGRTHPPLATQIAFQRSGHSRGRLAIRRLLGSLLAHTGAATCASCSMSDAAVLRGPAASR